jgi:hypothetical protein
MSSLRAVIVSGSGPVLVTTTVKVNVPPGSGRVDGSAVLSTRIDGAPVMVTVASSASVAVLPSSSLAVTVTMSVWVAPAAPAKAPGNVQVGELAPGASVVPMRAPQVEPGMAARFP